MEDVPRHDGDSVVTRGSLRSTALSGLQFDTSLEALGPRLVRREESRGPDGEGNVGQGRRSRVLCGGWEREGGRSRVVFLLDEAMRWSFDALAID